MKIKMNNNWKDPGHLICWLDGKLAMSQDIKLRSKGEKYGVGFLMFTVFFGGNDKSFAPRKDCKVYFDNIIISDNFSRIMALHKTLHQYQIQDLHSQEIVLHQLFLDNKE